MRENVRLQQMQVVFRSYCLLARNTVRLHHGTVSRKRNSNVRHSAIRALNPGRVQFVKDVVLCCVLWVVFSLVPEIELSTPVPLYPLLLGEPYCIDIEAAFEKTDDFLGDLVSLFEGRGSVLRGLDPLERLHLKLVLDNFVHAPQRRPSLPGNLPLGNYDAALVFLLEILDLFCDFVAVDVLANLLPALRS